jgi:hypothetical protein
MSRHRHHPRPTSMPRTPIRHIESHPLYRRPAPCDACGRVPDTFSGRCCC